MCTRSRSRLTAVLLLALVGAVAPPSTGWAIDCPEQILGQWDMENSFGVPSGNVLGIARESGKIVGTFFAGDVRWRLEGQYADGMYTGRYRLQAGTTVGTGAFQYAHHPSPGGRDRLDGQFIDDVIGAVDQWLSRPHAGTGCPSPTTTTTLPPSCPIPNLSSGAVGQGRGCPPPVVTAIAMPPVVVAGTPAPLVLTLSDEDGNANKVEVNELTENVHVGTVPIDPPTGGGTYALAITCHNTLPRIAAERTISVTVRDTHGNSGSARVTFSCVPKPLFPQLERWTNTAAGLIATGAGVFAPAPPWIKKAVITSGILWTTSGALSIYNNDPPDPNYTTIAEARPPPFAPFDPVTDDVPAEFADAVNAWIDNHAQATGIGRALVTSLERAQGAAAAGDVAWYTQQVAAGAALAGRWSAVFGAAPALAGQVQAAWRSAGLPDLEATAGDVAFWQELVTSFGLDAELTDVLVGLGADARELDVIATGIGTLDPEATAGSVTERLTDPEGVGAYQDASTALGAFAKQLSTPPPPADCGSCDDGDACTVDTCTAGRCDHPASGGVEAVCSSCQGGLRSAACAGQPVPNSVAKRLARACTLQARALISKPKKARAMARQAAANLRKASALVRKAGKKHKGALPAACVQAITGALQGAF